MKGTQTSPFGPRWGRNHDGVDIAAPTGTAIRAAACGSVSFAGQQSGYGNIVCITHTSQFSTCYAHMSRFAVTQGAQVRQGQVIGYVGCTGSCTGPHLHFETRVNGQAQTRSTVPLRRLDPAGTAVAPARNRRKVTRRRAPASRRPLAAVARLRADANVRVKATVTHLAQNEAIVAAGATPAVDGARRCPAEVAPAPVASGPGSGRGGARAGGSAPVEGARPPVEAAPVAPVAAAPVGPAPVEAAAPAEAAPVEAAPGGPARSPRRAGPGRGGAQALRSRRPRSGPGRGGARGRGAPPARSRRPARRAGEPAARLRSRPLRRSGPGGPAAAPLDPAAAVPAQASFGGPSGPVGRQPRGNRGGPARKGGAFALLRPSGTCRSGRRCRSS